MKYQNRELLEQLAAEYALGTLRGAARQRFERLLPQNPDALAAVRRWEDRLVGLAADVAPVEPRGVVWRSVELRLRHGKREPVETFGWWHRSRFALAAMIAMLAVGIVLRLAINAEPPRVIATIATEQQAQWWLIAVSDNREQLHVTAFDDITADSTHAYELWALPDSGAAPVSLGLMPQDGARQLFLNPRQRAALQQASKLAISLEPPTGSPTGAPTGRVLFVTEVIKSG
jgi:anti-sigma-K factor RskA